MAIKERVRPTTSHFEPTVLQKTLQTIAKLRNPGFLWDGTNYDALGRNLNPSLGGLSLHSAVLGPLLDVAPTGFPAHSTLRATLVTLHSDYNIFGDVPARLVYKTAQEAADHWRIMCRHCYELKKKPNHANMPEDVRVLVDKVVLPTPQAAAADTAAGEPSDALTPRDVDALFPVISDGSDDEADGKDCDDEADGKGCDDEADGNCDDEADGENCDDSDSVVFCGAKCMCDNCVRPGPVARKERRAAAPAAAPSGTATPTIPNPKRGARRRTRSRSSTIARVSRAALLGRQRSRPSPSQRRPR